LCFLDFLSFDVLCSHHQKKVAVWTVHFLKPKIKNKTFTWSQSCSEMMDEHTPFGFRVMWFDMLVQTRSADPTGSRYGHIYDRWEDAAVIMFVGSNEA
jgi:hypothetical protein